MSVSYTHLDVYKRQGLDGVASLPYGGYLGAGFVSEFYYNYYAPAPERADDSYFFAQGVRYDLDVYKRQFLCFIWFC